MFAKKLMVGHLN